MRPDWEAWEIYRAFVPQPRMQWARARTAIDRLG
jgi:hypothetical protein